VHLGKVSDDGKIGIVSKRNDELVDHESEDSELGGTSVVQLNGTLLELLLFGEGVPSEVDVSVTEVTNEFVSHTGDVTHEGALKDSNGGNHLDKSSGGDGVGSDKSGNTVGVRVERVSGVVDVSGKVDSCSGGDLSKECKHTDTSVLDLDVTKAVETIFLDISGEKSEGVEESKRGLGTELVLKGRSQSGGGSLLRSRGESGGRSQKGSEDGEFHFGI
jgi:hypothetical protein